jgi:hypothetical protein
MAKADVLQLVADLSASTADQVASGRFHGDIVYEMGLGKSVSLVGAAFVQVSGGTSEYTFPATTIYPLLLFYDDTVLTPSMVKEAEAYDKQWRTTLGEPRTWLDEHETLRTFDLVPTPRRDGAAVGVTTPFTGFPEGNVLMIYSENRTDVHAFEELIMALLILAREFDRESDHTDHDAAQYCVQLGALYQAMLASKR